MQYRIIDIIPASKDTVLTSMNTINRFFLLLKFYYKEMELAINNFIASKYSYFDAQVSESLCQVRAYMIYFYNSSKNEEKLFSFLEKIKEKLTNNFPVLPLLTNEKDKGGEKISAWEGCFVQQFIDHYGLDMDIPESVFFMVQIHLLSKYKVSGEHYIPHGVDYDKLISETKIKSKTYMKKIIHKLQRNVSNLCCRYILTTSSKGNEFYPTKLLEYLYCKDEVGRHVIACYEVTKCLLSQETDLDRFVRVVVFRKGRYESDTVVFTLASKEGSRTYQLCCDEDVEVGAVLTFTGICSYYKEINESGSEYIGRFMSIGFEEIILANMAQHTQYSGLLLKDLKHNPYLRTKPIRGIETGFRDYIDESEKEFMRHKILSESIGCSKHNKALFLLTHVLCSESSFYLNEKLCFQTNEHGELL